MINQLNATTWIEQVKSDPKDEIKVFIGDDKQPNFEPQQKIERWSNEVNCSFRLIHNEVAPTLTVEGDKIIWAGEKIEAHFYDLGISGEHPEGSREFEVILKEPPKTNVVEFTLETKGLDFFYQPELTQEEIDQGNIRPENVVGSYAIYASENKINYVGGKEYKCGKVGHIFRPKIIDSVGTEVWGDLHIENGILSVTIPQEFLNTATYPVRRAAGLEFGYHTAGASSVNVTSEYDSGHSQTGAAGNLTTVTVYTKRGGETDSAFKGALYLVSDRSKIEVGGETVISTGPNWLDSTGFTASISAVGYYITFGINTISTTFYFDTVASANRLTQSFTYPNFPTTGITLSSSREVSIYATYTAAGGGYGDVFISNRNMLKVGV